MKISKSAIAVALSTGLLFGCDFDVTSSDDSSGGGDIPSSSLSGAYWELAAASSTSATQSTDLPNVYVFDGTNQKYYNDDNSFGTYVIEEKAYTEGTDGSIKFHYYAADGTSTEESGSFAISADGVLTISGTNDGDLTGTDQIDNADIAAAVKAANDASGVNRLVQIQDTNAVKEDTGELRIKFSDSGNDIEVDGDAIAKGKLTVDLVYQLDEDTEQVADDTGNNAYVSFYTAAGTSTTNLHGEIAFEYKDSGVGVIKYRNASGDLTDTNGTFELGEELAVEANWDDGVFTFSVNGTEYAPADAVRDGAAVAVVALRLGDNGNTTQYELLGDNLNIYSVSDAGDETLFSDDFESHPVGQALQDNDFYNSNSNEAVVIEVGSAAGGDEGDADDEGDTGGDEGDTGGDTGEGALVDDFESYTAGTIISNASDSWITNNMKDDEFGTTTAEVSTAQSNGGSQSLYLEDSNTDSKPFVGREFASESASGSVSIDAYFPSANEQTTYINVGVGKNNSDRYFELRQTGTKIEYENSADGDVEIAQIEEDKWYTFTMSWTAAGIFTVKLNGEVIADNIDQSILGLDSANIPTRLTMYTGNDSGATNKVYFDNLKSDLF
ncbi:hypothetical protein A9264_05445 [Vibrio sp. UCD-FRSSP16_10]|uniref:hypothetical protein n=1 Tax=unclassified Vibrio TaxID=2614977 RepID=UPI00080217CF|nr:MULTISPECIES: hypothetical protein [unclassified Vibrio]OBT07915.1 hypothetical protein A9260_07685 [Vibrio sp. UCD-FRSSP16_30]OBT17090.1 hypothetical protein A9264_05445 [Vibrio sp. UCD-FRSSP16_10]